MTDPSHTGEPPRGATVPAPDAMAAVDALLARERAGRPATYALEDDPTALAREEVEAWIAGAEAEGATLVRYAVDAGGDGPVRVSLWAVAPAEGAA